MRLGRRLSRAMIVMAIFSFAIISSAYGERVSGRVVGVTDGDTITLLLDGNHQERIRLYGIDCPEKNQPFGNKAKIFCSDFAFNKTAELERTGTDRYGRTIGWVFINQKCLNEELLKAGLAWHYKQYSSDKSLSDIELFARTMRHGLWSESNPVPPWDFRHNRASTSGAGIAFAGVLGGTKNNVTGGLVYKGNIKSHKFHRPECRYYDCKNCTVEFSSRELAIKAGYIPCKICKP